MFVYGRWEDLDRWKWVVIDVGVFLDTPASHSESFFVFFSTLFGPPAPPIPQDPRRRHEWVGAGLHCYLEDELPEWMGAGLQCYLEDELWHSNVMLC